MKVPNSTCGCKTGVMTEYSCCDGPPDLSVLERLGPPPKPPWIQTNITSTCNNTDFPIDDSFPRPVSTTGPRPGETTSEVVPSAGRSSTSVSTVTSTSSVNSNTFLDNKNTFSTNSIIVTSQGDSVVDRGKATSENKAEASTIASEFVTRHVTKASLLSTTRDMVTIILEATSLFDNESSRGGNNHVSSTVTQRHYLVTGYSPTSKSAIQPSDKADTMPTSPDMLSTTVPLYDLGNDLDTTPETTHMPDNVPFTQTVGYHRDQSTSAPISPNEYAALNRTNSSSTDSLSVSSLLPTTFSSKLSHTASSSSNSRNLTFTTTAASGWKAESSSTTLRITGASQTLPGTELTAQTHREPSSSTTVIVSPVTRSSVTSNMTSGFSVTSSISSTRLRSERTTFSTHWEQTTTSENVNRNGTRLSSTHGNISSAEIALISLSVVIILAAISVMIFYFFYKKRSQFKVKPEEVEDSNFLYNYRMLGRRWEPEGSPDRTRANPGSRTQDVRSKPVKSRPPHRQPSYEDKAALIAGTPTSQMSLSSSGGDSAETPDPNLISRANFTPYVKRDNIKESNGHTDQYGIRKDAISYNVLMSESGPRDFSTMENGHTSLTHGGPLDSQETSFRGLLPILAPISSSHDPVFKPRGWVAGDLEPSLPSDSAPKRPSTLEPLTLDTTLTDRKRHRKRRKPPSPKQYNHVAMETISHDPAETVPIKNGESNA